MLSLHLNEHKIKTVFVGGCCLCCRRWRRQSGVGNGGGVGGGVGFGFGVGGGDGGVGGGSVGVGSGGGVGVVFVVVVVVVVGSGGVSVSGGDGDVADFFFNLCNYAECFSNDLKTLLSATSRRNLGTMDLRNIGNIIPSLLCHYPEQ